MRLLFCLFAEDTGIFEKRQLQDYIEQRTAEDGSDLAHHLGTLFYVLNTPAEQRLTNLDENLAAFPYINGKLFETMLPPASFDRAMREALLDLCGLDWSLISPAIFGSLFQSIMDDAARRNLGAHYTSEENILKLIKPLFLDDLWAEFEKVKGNKNRLFEFHKKLRTLTFFDPACGCGNFLVITYRELRRLELEVLRASRASGQQVLDVQQLIHVDVDQFYGIEIEEFPAQIAQVALWLTDHQMNLRVSEEFGSYYARIPLKATPHIVHGNALQIDWNVVLPAERCSFVLGNPPFVGKKEQKPEQKAELLAICDGIKGAGVLDYVSAWYVKAARYISAVRAEPVEAHSPSTSSGRTGVRCAFVSTNSITQGEQVGILWSWLLAQGVKIHFAHRTFAWNNEARGKAAVHCVIIGFGLGDVAGKTIFEYENIKGEAHAVKAANINPYLVDGENVLLENRKHPISDVIELRYGSFALDDGHYTLTADDREQLLARHPEASNFILPFLGGQELLHNEARYCLWLADANPADIRNLPAIKQRVELVRQWREKSNREVTRKLAATPTLFAEVRQPATSYLALPTTSSENRRYLPIAFLPSTVIASNQIYVLPDATLFHFGILTSTMPNAWVRSVCGRLKSDFRYSASIVYNNFPWPTPTDKQRAAIEIAAQAVLDARAAHPGASLADLYDPLTMPPDLVKAHQVLDKAVDTAYGYKGAATDAARVAFLFGLYQQITSLLPPAAVKTKRSRRAG